MIGTRDHWHLVEFSAGKCRADTLCKQRSIDERIHREWLPGDHRRGGYGAQTRGFLVAASDAIGDRGARGHTSGARCFGLRQRNNVGKVVLEFRVRSAFGYRSTEQARDQGRCEIGIDALSARRLAEYRDSMRIAAKGRDVPANPLERELLIHQPIVALEMVFSIDRGLGKESQITQAVIHGDDDHPIFHEPFRNVSIAAPLRESAAMNPKHHREAGSPAISRGRRGRKDVQEQAILAAAAGLRTLASELSCFKHKAGKGPVTMRWSPAKISYRRSRVGDAEKFVYPGRPEADHNSAFRESNRTVLGRCAKYRAQSDHADSRHRSQKVGSHFTAKPLVRLPGVFHR